MGLISGWQVPRGWNGFDETPTRGRGAVHGGTTADGPGLASAVPEGVWRDCSEAGITTWQNSGSGNPFSITTMATSEFRPAFAQDSRATSRQLSHARAAARRSPGRLMVLGTLALAALGTALLPTTSAAQAPVRGPIRLVVPFAAGSNTDVVTRMVQPGIAERLGTTLVVDNRPGANGIIGTELVAKAAADGLTFLVGGTSVNVINPWLYKALPYDTMRDFTPVARIGFVPFIMMASQNVPATNVAELIDYARRNPGKLAYGTPNGTTVVAMETFKRLARVDILGVPYKSSPQAMADLVSGQLQVLIADFGTAVPHIKAGRARLLGVTLSRRSALLPDVPTIDETIKGYDITAWAGILGPKGTSPELASRIFEALRGALATKEVQDRLATIGFEIAPLGPEPLSGYIQSQLTLWGNMTREAGIKPE